MQQKKLRDETIIRLVEIRRILDNPDIYKRQFQQPATTNKANSNIIRLRFT